MINPLPSYIGVKNEGPSPFTSVAHLVHNTGCEGEVTSRPQYGARVCAPTQHHPPYTSIVGMDVNSRQGRGSPSNIYLPPTSSREEGFQSRKVDSFGENPSASSKDARERTDSFRKKKFFSPPAANPDEADLHSRLEKGSPTGRIPPPDSTVGADVQSRKGVRTSPTLPQIWKRGTRRE